MAKKTKTNQAVKVFQDVATNTGLLLMTAAATVGMIELRDHPNKAVLPVRSFQPQFAFETTAVEQEAKSAQTRRTSEETEPHYISYTVAQRTPGRTGKI